MIGQSAVRTGGIERVTGAQRYTADIRLHDPLHVKLVHLPCARAAINRIDIEAARRVEGVRAILTADGMPRPVPRYGPAYADRPVLAIGETKFFGEPVAAIAAETREGAETAAALVRVEYQELPAVLTIDAALDAGSPLVQDPSLRPGDRFAAANILNEWRFGWGAVESAAADLVVENEYTFPMVTHFAIEPHAFLAAPDSNGVTIWSPVQHPYVLQRVVAECLGWPVSKVRVIAPDPGGGFGGKGWPKFEPLMALLALETGRPVRLVLTLEETFQAARRTSARVHVRTGFAASGRISFQDIAADFLLGAYADIGARVVSKASYAACGPYCTPHARVVSRALLSHTTPSTAFRGFGTPQAAWAIESQMDEAALDLGLDRVEIRRLNLPAKGEAFIPNDTPADGDWSQALEKAAHAIGWARTAGFSPRWASAHPSPEPSESVFPRTRGRGIALGLKSSATASVSFAVVRLHHDGSASVMSGTSDMGQGARTVFTQIAAQELGVPPDRITMVMGDTAAVPFDSSTSASRSTVFMGNAIMYACRDIREQLKQLAGDAFDVPSDSIQVSAGNILLADKRVSYAEVLKAYYGSSRGEVIGVGSSRSKHVPGHPLGGNPAFWELMCVAAEVEVDVETGHTDVLKLVLASDVGKALNPRQVESQDEGAAIMGLGHTLMEQILLDDHGRIANLGSLDYRIPTIQDIPPELLSVMIENRDGPGPYGAKGTGEGGVLAISAAIGSAVREAAGVAIRDLPLTPERVWRAIQENHGR